MSLRHIPSSNVNVDPLACKNVPESNGNVATNSQQRQQPDDLQRICQMFDISAPDQNFSSLQNDGQCQQQNLTNQQQQQQQSIVINEAHNNEDGRQPNEMLKGILSTPGGKRKKQPANGTGTVRKQRNGQTSAAAKKRAAAKVQATMSDSSLAVSGWNDKRE